MKDIIDQVTAWPYLEQLPASHAGLTLSLEMAEDGSQFNIFSYRDDTGQRSLSVLYDQATKDFLVRLVVGLNEFCDVSFISPDLASLETVLAAKLTDALDSLAGSRQYDSIFRAKKIIEWPYGNELPAEIDGFRLFIAPARPLKTVNGSYAIIDYSDFAAASSFSICYNIYRDEFFGQLRLRRTPQTIGTFDTRDLGELAAKLKQDLQPTLAKLRRSISDTEGARIP